MRRGQVTIFIILALVFVGALVLLSWLQSKDNIEIEERECLDDSDCAPIGCCNAEFCGPVNEMVACDYTSFNCTPGCLTETGSDGFRLGCGYPPSTRGSCKCVENDCVPFYPS